MKLYIILPLVGFGFIYLIGSFYETTFDITQWCEGSRRHVSMSGGLISALLAIIAALINNENKTK